MKQTNEESTITKKEVTVTPEPEKPAVVKHPMGFWKAILAAFLSRKFLTTMIVFGLIWWCHEITINHLYTLTEPHQSTALTTIYVATLSVLGAICAAFLGANTIQTKFGISGVSQLISQTLTEKSERTENQNTTIDQTIHEYVKEEGVNAPELKPFGQQAVGDDQDGEYKDS